MATLEDIAKKIGVSKSTVSKALSGAGDVSESMRRLVLESAVELGYSRLRRSDDMQKLVILTADSDCPHRKFHTDQILMAMRKLAQPRGYLAEAVPLAQAMAESTQYEEFMMGRNYRGAFFLDLPRDHPWMAQIRFCRIPTVLYGSHAPGNPHVTCLTTDSREGMHTALSFLAGLGHRKIGCLGGDPDAFPYRQRKQAFFQILQQLGLPADPGQEAAEADPDRCIRQQLPRLMDMGCTAILCSRDELALRALEYCRETGVSVPGQLSILSFEDLPLDRSVPSNLSAVRQDLSGIGKAAFCALANQMEEVYLSALLLHTRLDPGTTCGAVER